MKRFALVLTCLLIAAGSVESEPASVASTLQSAIRERLDAYARKDAAGWASHVDKDCFCGGATKAGIEQEIAARPASLKNWYGDVESFTVQVHGEVAMARYRVNEFIEIGGRRIELDEWRTETYLRREGRWLLLGGADVVIPHDPSVAQINPRLYDSYVGRYEYAPGLLDQVTREGDRLFIQSTGQEKEELFPENDSTFFAKRQDWRVIFDRDDKGTVVSLRFRQNNQDLVAKRLP